MGLGENEQRCRLQAGDYNGEIDTKKTEFIKIVGFISGKSE